MPGPVVGAGDPPLPVETIPDCGCDACDSGSRNLLELLDQVILSIVDGSYEALISPDGRREPALEWTHALDEDAEEPEAEGGRPSPHHGGRASPPPLRRTTPRELPGPRHRGSRHDDRRLPAVLALSLQEGVPARRRFPHPRP
ncbi:DUF6226 family protein [Brachybacterium paraconglomeratum]|uniref:DUF6226 family protein n=1 Tax=Brachybacterium paraconglomeratum TaxID=173362 RepID=UPI003B8A95C4